MLAPSFDSPPVARQYKCRRRRNFTDDIPPLPIEIRAKQSWFSSYGPDVVTIRAIADGGNEQRRAYASCLIDSHRVMGNHCYGLSRAGELILAEAIRALTEPREDKNGEVKGTLCCVKTARRRIADLVRLGIWDRVPGCKVLRHKNWEMTNPSAAEMARRADDKRQKATARKRRERQKTGNALPLRAKKTSTISSESKNVTPLYNTPPGCRPEKPRASALHPDSPSSSTASFTSHRPPHIGPWVPRQPPPVPPRPFTDTDLDSLADELDAETKRLARRRQRGESSGGPPATPEPPGWKAVFSSPAPASEDPSPPQAPPSPSPEAPSNTEVPRSPTELRALMHAAGAAGNYDAMTRYADLLEAASASPPAQAPRPERSVAIAEDKKKDEPKPVPAPAVSPRSGPRQSPVLAAATPPATLATPETLRALERHHGVSGFNTQAAINLRVTHDTARQAFEIGMEARARGKGGRGPSVGDLRRYILGTMRKLSAGWGPLPRGP